MVALCRPIERPTRGRRNPLSQGWRWLSCGCNNKPSIPSAGFPIGSSSTTNFGCCCGGRGYFFLRRCSVLGKPPPHGTHPDARAIYAGPFDTELNIRRIMTVPTEYDSLDIVSTERLERELKLVRGAAAGSLAGVFGPRSITWQVDREAAIFLGAGRALLLQLAHPWIAAAVE